MLSCHGTEQLMRKRKRPFVDQHICKTSSRKQKKRESRRARTHLGVEHDLWSSVPTRGNVLCEETSVIVVGIRYAGQAKITDLQKERHKNKNEGNVTGQHTKTSHSLGLQAFSGRDKTLKYQRQGDLKRAFRFKNNQGPSVHAVERTHLCFKRTSLQTVVQLE